MEITDSAQTHCSNVRVILCNLLWIRASSLKKLKLV